MKKNLRYIFVFILIFALTSLFAACTNKEIDNAQQLAAVRVYLFGGDKNVIPNENAAIPRDVYGDIVLPVSYGDCTIAWMSSYPDIISAEGKFNSPEQNTEVQLTARVTVVNKTSKNDKDGNFATYTIPVIAHHVVDDETRFEKVKAWLDSQIPDSMISKVVLPTEAADSVEVSCDISWESNDIQLLSSAGERLNFDVSCRVILTATIRLDNGKTKTWEREINLLPFNPEDDASFFEFVELTLGGMIPDFVGTDINMPASIPLGEAQAILIWTSSNASIIGVTGQYVAPETQTDITLSALIKLPNGKTKTFVKKVSALPEGTYPAEIQNVINEIDYKFTDRRFGADIPADYMMKSCNGATISWMSSNNTVIDGGGKYLRPTYDKAVVLTAKIKLGSYIVEHRVEVTALGLVSVPEPSSLRPYLAKIIGNSIVSDLYLPCKYNEAEVKGVTTDIVSEDIKIAWRVSSGDTDVLINGNQIRRQTYDVPNIVLTASFSFDGEELGELDFFNVTVKAVTKEEMYRYANSYIKKHLTMNVSDGFTLPTVTDRYDVNISWTTSNISVANIKDGVVEVAAGAPNMSTIALRASFMVDGQVLGGTLSYNVNILTSNHILAYYDEYSELIPDEALRKLLVSRFGTFNVLTTDSFQSTNMSADKWYKLDLSYNPNAEFEGTGINQKITDLRGIGYISTLRSLDISGQDKLTELSEISALKNLEVIKAAGCGISEINNGGLSPFRALKKLYFLDLSGNKISSPNILEGGDYNHLEYLYLHDNSISNIDAITLASGLKYLTLSNNSIEDILPLSVLRNLEFLLLDGNKITDVSPLSYLTMLKTLRLDRQKAVLEDIDALAGLVKMISLNISGNSIYALDAVKDMKDLRILDASDNIIDSGAYHLASLTKLERLILNNNQISGSTDFIRALTGLTHLMLENNEFSNNNFSAHVSGLTKLQVLTVSSYNTRFVIDKLDFLEQMPELIHFAAPYSSIPQTYAGKDENGDSATFDNTVHLAKAVQLKYLDISGEKFTDISELYTLTNLIEFFMNDLNIVSNGANTGHIGKDGNYVLGSLHLKVLSAANTNLTTIEHNGRSLFADYDSGLWFLNISGNKLTQVDLSVLSSNSKYNNLQYLYINSDNPYEIKNAELLGNYKKLVALGLSNGELSGMPAAFSKTLEYLNLSGAYDYNLDVLKTLRQLHTLVLENTCSELSPVTEISGLQKLNIVSDDGSYRVLTPVNTDVLQQIYDKVNVYLYFKDVIFEPNAKAEGDRVLGLIDCIDVTSQNVDINIDVNKSGGKPIFVLETEQNGFSISWSFSDSTHFGADADGNLFIVNPAGLTSGVMPFTFTAELSVYGKRVQKDYHIQFNVAEILALLDKQGGIGGSDQAEVIIGADMPEGKSAPKKNGYTFKGFFSEKNGQGTKYYDEKMHSAHVWDKTGKATLYAYWVANKYSVTLKSEGNADRIIEVTYDAAMPSLSEIPNLPFYSFNGYFDAKSGAGKQYYRANLTGLNKWDKPSDATLYAHWEKTFQDYTYVSQTPRTHFNEIAFNAIQKDLGGKYMLISDISLGEWAILNDFSGILDGKDFSVTYSISRIVENVSPNSIEHCFGLFKYNRGTIRNLRIKDANLWFGTQSGSSNHDGDGFFTAGFVCGVNFGTIENAVIEKGAIHMDRSRSHIGGIAGRIEEGSIKNCKILGSYFYSNGDIGGFVGRMSNGTIDHCVIANADSANPFSGTSVTKMELYQVKDSRTLGGFVGYMHETAGVIKNCAVNDISAYIFNKVKNIKTMVGLLVGWYNKDDDKFAEHIVNAVMADVTYKDKSTPFPSGSSRIDFKYEQGIDETYWGKYYQVAGRHSGQKADDSKCIATGTLITLADGSRVPVEKLTGSETLLVWNLFTGTFDTAPILFIDSECTRYYNVVKLHFSDGTEVDLIGEHGFWDFDLNQYVFLDENAADFIGHMFNKQTTDSLGNRSWTRVRLENVTINIEETRAWSPVTYGHLCYYVNGMLSMPGATEGFINIFEVDGKTMKYDGASFKNDVERYGLFTYDDFVGILPEPVFNAFNGQYLKVSMGKGLIDWPTVYSLVDRYRDFWT